MQARMKNPAVTVPGAMQAMLALGGAGKDAGVPQNLLTMIHLRASQINNCGFCTDMHARELKQAGESDERIWSVAAWREAPYFSDAERAVLALTESATRLADRTDAVPDEIWEAAKHHFNEAQLGVIVIHIALINAWNRINVTIRQPAGKLG
jgi:AhpD family alkylhydroperoxidase